MLGLSFIFKQITSYLLIFEFTDKTMPLEDQIIPFRVCVYH